MLQAKQVLQERYYLQQSLGQNAGCQTWLAQERSLTLKVIPIEPLPRLEADGIQASSKDCRIKSCLTSSTPRVGLPTLLIFNAAFMSRSLTE